MASWHPFCWHCCPKRSLSHLMYRLDRWSDSQQWWSQRCVNRRFNPSTLSQWPHICWRSRTRDLLEVELLDIGALRDSQWGFTGIFARENGGGFLTDHFPKAHKAIWDFEGKFATSRHIPNVKLAGMLHPGIIGTAPSHELLKEWNDR